ncbi:MAG: glycogen-binding domain-containing protein [Elusimicrobiales bacterium]|jgi:hypothetical protein
MIERKSVLVVAALLALGLVSIPTVLFHNALTRYLSFMGHWSVATVRPSRNGQIPPIHLRTSAQRADNPQPELRFIKFTIKIANAKTVHLAGEFNKWDLNSLALVKRDKNVWGTIVPLTPGVYQYLYNIDGQVILDPLNPDTAVAGGKKVSVITVK